jgi:hypothetical protein
MIHIRTVQEPNVIKTYSNRKAILDLIRWGWVLEIVHDDEAPVVANDEGSVFPDPETVTNESGEPVPVLTLEQLELLNETFSDDFPFEEEQE